MYIIRKGEQIEIKVEVSDTGSITARLFYNISISGWPSQLKPPQEQSKDIRQKMIASGKGDYWIFGSIAGMIALSPAEATELQSEFESAKRNWTPGMEYWIKERAKIVEDIHINRQIASKQRDRGFESGDGTGRYVHAGDQYDAEADKDSEKLAEFDRQHPEVIAEIRRRRSEAAERNIWN